ncbi:MAG: hypothetical protein JRJ69_07130 [Deltaproteobacteria bacterium]|nr:hypothetical protein [Deltaproteobacteria bacterium]MBW1737319.1 hypothetical protein [Deltaproteobacteria bacterium]MBW1910186.1 hypothetical protein [Deltaproteobacteria bacterium]MBW2032868.1 hypothetical protein [Deltaproteobacteria bacterium]MBW2114696.1 hypothetical protein [Deltaproteobacteria bacterium]
MKKHDKDPDPQKTEKREDRPDEQRREFIKKLAWVTPVVTTLLITHDFSTPDSTKAQPVCVRQCACRRESPCRTVQPCRRQCCVQTIQPCRRQPCRREPCRVEPVCVRQC